MVARKKAAKRTIYGNEDITAYLESIDSDNPKACRDLHNFSRLVKNAFLKGDCYVNQEQYESYLAIGEAMFKTPFPWEKCLTALISCTYRKSDNRPRWNHALVMIGRGAGKDGWIAWQSLCYTSKNNPVPKYDVDVCANNEDQAVRPVKDAIDFLNDPHYKEANTASFYWTSEIIRGKANGGRIKGHTNNPRGKDGLRSGCIILNEIHEYEDYGNISVFTTGLGKKANPRSIYITTNGNVREGVLDDELAQAEEVLAGDIEDNGFLPFICRLDAKSEVHDESNWVKANPSLPYLPDLLDETRNEYLKWKDAPATAPQFMSKRMNLPDLAGAHAVTDYDNIKATNVPFDIEALRGAQCIVGIDTSKTTDFEAVSAIIKRDKKIYVINHTWVCLQSKDLGRVKFREKFPELVDMGLLTLVDDVEISPEYIVSYIQELKKKFVILKVCIDDFRYSLFSSELNRIGFSKQFNNLKLVRPSDIAKTVPIIESAFINHAFIWGDNPMLRWATNNTKVIPWKAKTTNGADMGNQLYAKIEPKSRKTDPFMSLVHAMTAEPELLEVKPPKASLFKARVY